MTTAQTKGIISKIIEFKLQQNKRGIYEGLVYILSDTEKEEIRSLRMDNSIPEMCFGVRLK